MISYYYIIIIIIIYLLYYYNVSVLGCLPEHNVVDKPSMITWGTRSDGSLIVIPTSIITDAYNEIVTWRKNVFLVPYGKTGREFIDQVTLIRSHCTLMTGIATLINSTYP